MFVIDTNLLLYAVNPASPEHRRARGLVDQWRRGDRAWFLTWSIVYEFLRVSTHARVFPHPMALRDAQAWIGALLGGRDDRILVATDRHRQVLDDAVASHPHVRGNPVHDLHIATLMMEHGVPEIRTADADFHQFRFLRVVNPLTTA